MIRQPNSNDDGNGGDETLTPLVAVSSSSPGTMGCVRMQFATTSVSRPPGGGGNNADEARRQGRKKQKTGFGAMSPGDFSGDLMKQDLQQLLGPSPMKKNASGGEPGFAPLTSQNAMSSSRITGSSSSSQSTVHFEDPKYGKKKKNSSANSGSRTNNADGSKSSSGSGGEKNGSSSSGGSEGAAQSPHRSPCSGTGSSSSSSGGEKFEDSESSPQ